MAMSNYHLFAGNSGMATTIHMFLLMSPLNFEFPSHNCCCLFFMLVHMHNVVLWKSNELLTHVNHCCEPSYVHCSTISYFGVKFDCFHFCFVLVFTSK